MCLFTSTSELKGPTADGACLEKYEVLNLRRKTGESRECRFILRRRLEHST